MKKKTRDKKLCKRTVAERERDTLYCSELFLRGFTYRDIARLLNDRLREEQAGYYITHQQVYKDIQAALIEWKRERLDNIDDYITQELRKLDVMEVEAWSAWNASKEGKRREKNRTSSRSRKVLTEEEKTADYYGYDETATESSAGNPKFLDLLLDIQQRRAKLLGYDAPQKIDVTQTVERTDTESIDVSDLPDDVLFDIVDKIQAARYDKIMANRG